MGLDRTRAYLLSLPFVEETLQWDVLVYWVLDKAVGGKMFAMLPPDMNRPHVAGFAARPELYNDLLEIEGVRPAPYLARAQWVVVERWDILLSAICTSICVRPTSGWRRSCLYASSAPCR